MQTFVICAIVTTDGMWAFDHQNINKRVFDQLKNFQHFCQNLSNLICLFGLTSVSTVTAILTSAARWTLTQRAKTANNMQCTHTIYVNTRKYPEPLQEFKN
jgi:uncharacterized BrkB/YihY/UPF0761 family membrane protein